MHPEPQSIIWGIKKHTNYLATNDVLHWHDEIELIYFIDGEVTTSCNLNEYEIKGGEILVVNSKELHKTVVCGRPCTFYCLQVNLSFFNNLIGDDYVIFDNIIRDVE